jgi:hypothetical protein
MQLLVRSVFGAALAGLLFIMLATAAHFALGKERLGEVTREAFAAGALDFAAHWPEDYFTECVLLMTLHLRHDSLARDVVDTRWAVVSEQPCLVLRGMLEGKAVEPFSYASYAFASRHLGAIVASAMSIAQARQLYGALSYGSVVLLLFAAWRASPATAAIVLPLGLVLLFGFAQHLLGHNLAHSPGFFLGILGLAFLIGLPRSFQERNMRLLLFGFLGGVVACFDLLNGATPAMVCLAVGLNHLFYVAPHRGMDTKGYARFAAKEAAAVVACFILAYLAVTIPRVLLLTALYDPAVGGWQFWYRLKLRMGTDLGNGTSVGWWDVAMAIRGSRQQLTGDSKTAATVLLAASLIAWLGSFAAIGLALRRRMLQAGVLTTDVLVMAFAGSGIIVWFLLFPNHTVIHRFMTGRLIAIPAAYGFVAAALVLQFWRRSAREATMAAATR